MHYTYILKCADNTLYTGYTVDPKRRLEEHNSGEGAKYTRCRLPVEMVYLEEFETRAEATKREAAIKKLTRNEKDKLINSYKKSGK